MMMIENPIFLWRHTIEACGLGNYSLLLSFCFAILAWSTSFV